MTLESPSYDAAAADWRSAVARGRFGLAAQSYRLQGGTDADERAALDALAQLEALVRDKAWARAKTRLEALEERPPIVDWAVLEADLAGLTAAGEALDRRTPEPALEALEALRSDYFQAERATLRGTAWIYDGRLEDARGAFEQALAVDPNHYRALTNLGNVALEQGRVDEAIAAYQRALKLNDGFPNAHHNLGVAYRRKGQVAASVRELRKAQRAMQRQDAQDARERLQAGTRNAGRWLRWLFYGVVAVGLYLVLKSRGIL